ncbi:MAG: glucose-6-phosphate isomerase [Clostridia bacterium]|nr:glucose-6-phosphate isomerase [Clostridia bacterium]
MIKINYEKAFINKDEIYAHKDEVLEAEKKLHEKTGEGSDFLGWVDLKLDEEELTRVKNAALKIREISDVLVVIGIGGSYLGARAVIDALSHNFKPKNVIFAGNNLSSDYLNDLLEYIDDKRVCLNVISKSGTTIEPAISFKILREYMEKKYGEDGARERIFVTTDAKKGVLKEIANNKGYETFVVPDDIGGRYSVFTPVGLLPIAAAGLDIDKLLQGVFDAKENFKGFNENNPCYEYAAARTILYRQGKKIELLANYEPKLHYITEWWKQLFGESEGKDGKGLFPAGVDYTTDLHSMGQYVQEGERHLFETVLNVKEPYRNIFFECAENSMDKLEYLNGKNMNEANHSAMEGTIIAHTNGNVPNIILEIEKIDEYHIGELLYFFEKACGISGYMLGVNPFNQPGVEAYKKEMFRLLGKA